MKTEDTKSEETLQWSYWPEAFNLFFQGITVRACVPVAIIVGIILSTINQSDVILSGNTTLVLWLKVGMNFVVPFCVSSYGFLNARRLPVQARTVSKQWHPESVNNS